MEIRKIKPEELLAARKVQAVAFNYGVDFSKDPVDGHYENVVAAFSDSGKLCSCVESIPFETWFDGNILKMAGIGNVASLPEERNHGYVRAVIRYVLESARKNGQWLSYLYPFSHAYYRKFGYETCTAIARITVPLSEFSGFRSSGNVAQYFPGDDFRSIAGLYERFASGRNFMIRRTEDAWKRRLGSDPYRDSRYTYVWYGKNGKAGSYLIFKIEKGHKPDLSVEEFVWTDAESIRGIFSMLRTFAPNYRNFVWSAPRSFDARLFFDEPYAVKTELCSGGMCRIVDFEQVLSHLRAPEGKGRIAIEIKDGFLAWNNGVFSFSWEAGQSQAAAYDGSPDLVCGIEGAAQLLSGYACPEDLELAGKAELRSHRELLAKVFCRKTTFINDAF